MDPSKIDKSGLINEGKAETCPSFTINSQRLVPSNSKLDPIDANSTETESNSRSEGSCPTSPVYFEMVQPPYPSCATRAIVVVFEEDEMVEFEFVNPQASRSKTAVSKKQDLEEIDTLDGQHLPHFFSYTREEREWIRGSSGRGGKEVRLRNQQPVEGDDFSNSWSFRSRKIDDVLI